MRLLEEDDHVRRLVPLAREVFARAGRRIDDLGAVAYTEGPGLAGALLAYRPPAFIALNEPEASLHPDLLPPLARMIVNASERTQVWVVTHSERLAAAIEDYGSVRPRRVVKRDGATTIEGLKFGTFFEDEDFEDED